VWAAILPFAEDWNDRPSIAGSACAGGSSRAGGDGDPRLRNLRRRLELLGRHERIEQRGVQQRVDERRVQQRIDERRIVVGKRLLFREWIWRERIRRIDVGLGEREHIERKRER
jgi:hypothetical protein